MAWIESHQALERHPKIIRLSTLMNWSLDETIGKLHRFWWWCLDYATDGRLEQFDHATIASVFGVKDGTSEFVQHMIDVKLFDFEPQIRVHDWWDYSGRFLQVRYKRTPKIWKEIKRFYGHSVQRTNNRTTTEQQPINNHKPNQPTLNQPTLNQPTLNQPTLNQPTNDMAEQDAPPALGVGDVVDLWNRTPGVKPIGVVTGPITQTLKRRIKEHPDRTWFVELFLRVGQSDFLAGRKTDFVATLDWVMGPKNLAKILAGNYDNREVVSSFQRGINDFLARHGGDDDQ